MYSPKINEAYIPFLYRKAKTKRIPMTRLVNQIIAEYFLQTLPETIMEEDLNQPDAVQRPQVTPVLETNEFCRASL